MTETSEIPLSQKTLRSPNKDIVLEKMTNQGQLEQQARDTVANELTELRKNPLYKTQRKKLLEGIEREKKLEEINIIDPLTGLHHRRFLDGDPNAVPPKKGILERELERMLSGKKDLAVAMLDIDYFKQINDKYGHQIGDEVLKKVTQTILDNIRSELGDFAIRYGGEEFFVITPNGSDRAQQIIERIRKEVEKIQFNNDDYPKKITISCGLTNFTEKERNQNAKEIAKAMIKRADAALYKSKSDGRNQTTVVVQETDGVKYIKITPEKKA